MGGLSGQELIVLILLFLAIFFGFAILIFMAVLIRRRQGSTTPGESARCSFCGKPQGQVKRLIAGQAAYICDECVAVCNRIVSDENITDAKVSFPS